MTPRNRRNADNVCYRKLPAGGERFSRALAKLFHGRTEFSFSGDESDRVGRKSDRCRPRFSSSQKQQNHFRQTLRRLQFAHVTEISFPDRA
jgi:hypothetical protein